MSLVITGSLAFDHIMVFHDKFRNHILPEKLHVLNVSFQVDSLTRHFGGTAGNVAYNLALLGQKSLILGSAGKDFYDYAKHLTKLNLSTEYIKIFSDEYTAQAFITTDLDDNQITAFHMGAMKHAHEQSLSVVCEPIDLVLIGPNQVQAIMSYSDYCRKNRIHFWFDPGQSLSRCSPRTRALVLGETSDPKRSAVPSPEEISGEELVSAFTGADGIVVNDYEWEMMREKTGLSVQQILERVQTVLITLGEKGVDILSDGVSSKHISAVPNIKVVDPTGAGDAFRAGLLYGLMNNHDLDESCRYACAVASFAVESSGTQNHVFSKQDLEERINALMG